MQAPRPVPVSSDRSRKAASVARSPMDRTISAAIVSSLQRAISSPSNITPCPSTHAVRFGTFKRHAPDVGARNQTSDVLGRCATQDALAQIVGDPLGDELERQRSLLDLAVEPDDVQPIPG